MPPRVLSLLRTPVFRPNRMLSKGLRLAFNSAARGANLESRARTRLRSVARHMTSTLRERTQGHRRACGRGVGKDRVTSRNPITNLLPRIKRINKVKLYRPAAGEPDLWPGLAPAMTRYWWCGRIPNVRYSSNGATDLDRTAMYALFIAAVSR